MQEPFEICGNGLQPSASARNTGRWLPLTINGEPNRITLKISDIAKRLYQPIPPAFVDLLEIAAFVYAADQALRRGRADGVDHGEGWRRRLVFRIPVRQPDFWQKDFVQAPLRETLGFLSDDDYEFVFLSHPSPPACDAYIELSQDCVLGGKPEAVALFSGGLDSLAGAVHEVKNLQRRVALVNHVSNYRTGGNHDRLRDDLASIAGNHRPFFIRIEANKRKKLSKEYTQRSRSFLYATLGATIAAMFDLRALSFYENGVVSFNLPTCHQVVGARATRTTHPRVLDGFQTIFSEVTGAKFTVRNGFIWKTKREIIDVLKAVHCEHLIRYSMSCAHSWMLDSDHGHCGECSQCIDRRFAVLAAGVEAHDPNEQYIHDLFHGSRTKPDVRTLIGSYVEHANAIAKLSDVEFLTRHGLVARLVHDLTDDAITPIQVARQVIDLHRRHAQDINQVVDTALGRAVTEIRERTLDERSLLAMVKNSAGQILSSAGELREPRPAVTASSSTAPNWWRPMGQGIFHVRFDGGDPFYIPDIAGAPYVHWLIDTTPQPISIPDLVREVHKAGTAERHLYEIADIDEIEQSWSTNQGSMGTQVQGIDLDTAQQALRNIEARIADEDYADDTELADLRRQRTVAKKVIADLGRQKRKKLADSDPLEIARKGISKNIRDLVALIRTRWKQPALADHLTAKAGNLLCGYRMRYAPRSALIWDTSPSGILAMAQTHK